MSRDLCRRCPAWGAEVVSSNIVGYQKITLAKGYTQIGIQFQEVGSDGVNTVNGLGFTGLNGYDWDSGEAGDELTIWDASKQGYLNTYLWAADDPLDLGIGANVWFDEGELAAADVDLTVGDSVFVKSSATAATAVISGEVPSSNNASIITKTLAAGYNQFANPFPVAISINDLTFTGLVGYDWDSGEAGDELTIWDASKQGYLNTYLWAADDPLDLGIGAGVWFDEGELATADVTIPVGGTVFVKAQNGGTVTFTAP